MRAIRRAIRTGRTIFPVAVWTEAHRRYPVKVAEEGLYGAAFFGHGIPDGTKRTPESVWRGTVRSALRDATGEEG